jgi:hypothetical protein
MDHRLRNGLTDDALKRVANAIRDEQRQKVIEAIQSLWRIGDTVGLLRERRRNRGWRRDIEACARCAGMHPATLDEALRASDAFPAADRERLLCFVRHARGPITPSHIVELARHNPSRRKAGIEMLVQTPHSIRELRACLRRGSCEHRPSCEILDSHRIRGFAEI